MFTHIIFMKVIFIIFYLYQFPTRPAPISVFSWLVSCNQSLYTMMSCGVWALSQALNVTAVSLYFQCQMWRLNTY